MNAVGIFTEKGEVLCLECAGDCKNTTILYRENIYPYNQHCHRCKKRIVSGSTSKNPELFD